MIAIQVFLWIFMILGMLGLIADEVRASEGWFFFVWLISLLLLIATKLFI